jgi:hypothetical protein
LRILGHALPSHRGIAAQALVASAVGADDDKLKYFRDLAETRGVWPL